MKGFTDWINTPREDASDKDLKHIWDATASYKNGYVPNVAKRHEMFMEKMRAGQQPSAAILPMRRGINIWRAAAMIAFLVVAGIAIKHFTGQNASVNQIVTSKNEQNNLKLEDGSVISLNGSSSLSFPSHFNNDERTVTLVGEAFFEVAKDESTPFKVELENATVEVLGTSFNIRSFGDEGFLEVFVKTGKVKVNITGNLENHVLSPGELLHVDLETKEIEKITDDSAVNAIAWKSGKLIFKNQPMGKIFNELGRHFQVTFELENSTLKNCPYTINFNTDKLEDAIKGLEMSCNLTFKNIQDGAYVVSGSCCE